MCLRHDSSGGMFSGSDIGGNTKAPLGQERSLFRSHELAGFAVSFSRLDPLHSSLSPLMPPRRSARTRSAAPADGAPAADDPVMEPEDGPHLPDALILPSSLGWVRLPFRAPAAVPSHLGWFCLLRSQAHPRLDSRLSGSGSRDPDPDHC